MRDCDTLPRSSRDTTRSDVRCAGLHGRRRLREALAGGDLTPGATADAPLERPSGRPRRAHPRSTTQTRTGADRPPPVRSRAADARAAGPDDRAAPVDTQRERPAAVERPARGRDARRRSGPRPRHRSKDDRQPRAEVGETERGRARTWRVADAARQVRRARATTSPSKPPRRWTSTRTPPSASSRCRDEVAGHEPDAQARRADAAPRHRGVAAGRRVAWPVPVRVGRERPSRADRPRGQGDASARARCRGGREVARHRARDVRCGHRGAGQPLCRVAAARRERREHARAGRERCRRPRRGCCSARSGRRPRSRTTLRRRPRPACHRPARRSR